MKFIVTDYWKCEWRCSEHYDIGKDGDGNVNNVLVVEPVTNVDEGDISDDIEKDIDSNINEAIDVEPTIYADENGDIFENKKEDTNEDIKKVTEDTPAINVQFEENKEKLREALEKMIFIM